MNSGQLQGGQGIFRENLQGQTQLPGGSECNRGFSGGASSSGSAETPVAARAARVQVLDWLEWTPENASTKDVGAPTAATGEVKVRGDPSTSSQNRLTKQSRAWPGSQGSLEVECLPPGAPAPSSSTEQDPMVPWRLSPYAPYGEHLTAPLFGDGEMVVRPAAGLASQDLLSQSLAGLRESSVPPSLLSTRLSPAAGAPLGVHLGAGRGGGDLSDWAHSRALLCPSAGAPPLDPAEWDAGSAARKLIPRGCGGGITTSCPPPTPIPAPAAAREAGER